MLAEYIGLMSSRERLVTVLSGGVWMSSEGKFGAESEAEAPDDDAALLCEAELLTLLETVVPQPLSTSAAADTATVTLILPRIEIRTVLPHEALALLRSGAACSARPTYQCPGGSVSASVSSRPPTAVKISGSR